MAYRYVPSDEFTPETRHVNWSTVGKVRKWTRDEEGVVDKFTLFLDSGHKIYIYFLSHTTFRVRFNPDATAPYVPSRSPGTEVERIDACEIDVLEEDGYLKIFTNTLEVRIRLSKYALSVYRGRQLVHAESADYNLVYIPHELGGEAVACFKRMPDTARYYGGGEKAGATLDKRRVPKQHYYGIYGGEVKETLGAAMTFFNFDNFGYDVPDVTPKGEVQGPLNPDEPLYQSSPFIIEHNPDPQGDYFGPPYSYGILVDNTSQTYINLRQSDKYYFGALHGELDYYFFFGDHVQQVLNEFTQLTGRTNLKPKYILGYHQGGYGPKYNTKEKILDMAREYRRARIPCDGLHIDVDMQNNFRTFTVSPKKFPNAKEMFDKLHAGGFKTSTNITPIISCNVDEDGKQSAYKALDTGKKLGAFVRDTREDGSGTHEFFIGNVNYGRGYLQWGHYPDLGRSDVQTWWGNQYKDLLDYGLDFVWQDMTTPAMKASIHQDPNPFLSFPMDIMMSDNEETRYHDDSEHIEDKKPFAKIRNVFNFNLCKATYKGLERLQPDKRHFIIARGGFIGVHKYAGLWTGDSTSNWEFIQMNIPLVIGIGLSGQPVSGCDVGGFCAAYHGQIVDAEMLCRWTIMGAFLPWFRNHYDNYNKPYQEPFCYPEPTPSICRKFIELRYRLIQVIYDAMEENTRTGKPICRPLFMNEMEPDVFTEDPASSAPHGWCHHGYKSNRVDDQFFLGRDLLVAPIVNPGQNRRPVYLPHGNQWYAYTYDRAPLGPPVLGGTEIDFYAPWNDVHRPNCPLYVREGAILPLREVEQYIGELHSQGKVNPITFSIYPGRNNKYRLYLDDDGTTRDAETKGKYRLVEISHQAITFGKKITVKKVYDGFQPKETFYYLSLLGTSRPKKVTVGGDVKTDMKGATDEENATFLHDSTEDGYYYNYFLKTTFVKVFDDQDEATILVHY